MSVCPSRQAYRLLKVTQTRPAYVSAVLSEADGLTLIIIDRPIIYESYCRMCLFLCKV